MSKAKWTKSKGGYFTYRFMDKDPIIDIMRTAVQDSGMPLAKIEQGSGVTAATMRNWFEGSTRRPQFASVNAVARALGKDLVLVDKVDQRANGAIRMAARTNHPQPRLPDASTIAAKKRVKAGRITKALH